MRFLLRTGNVSRRLLNPRVFMSTVLPGLDHFIKTSNQKEIVESSELYSPFPPYLKAAAESTKKKKVFIETYGCQMNFNDTEIVLGILSKSSLYERCPTIDDADVILLMTCAIRENAEAKIWNRLEALRSLERRLSRNMVIGVLGCMAERLKEDILERRRNVDVVCGPDAYRDLPRLLQAAESGQSGINTILSFDETYADVAPVRIDKTKKSAYISIMRGCDNMCAYCVVPFTRGRERSRPVDSIVAEARNLREEGVKEITLLGQNVNSYRDDSIQVSTSPVLSEGFKTVYRPKSGGLRFSQLLDAVSLAVPDVRIRFTSPHPKDFPDDLLYLMKERWNICKQIHLPAQSGSTQVLERMRRGYSREAYLNLVERIRSIIPNVALSSDFIVGFCGESEEDHQETISLVRQVGYDMAYMYAYSMREKTMAHRRYTDNVPEEVKQARLRELIDTFYLGLTEKTKDLIGSTAQVMVEGPSKKNPAQLCGRSDSNKMVVFDVPEGLDLPIGSMADVLITHVSGSTPIGHVKGKDMARN